jgi:hypothetical protein
MKWTDELDPKTVTLIYSLYYGTLSLAVAATVFFLGIPAVQKMRMHNQTLEEAGQFLKSTM